LHAGVVRVETSTGGESERELVVDGLDGWLVDDDGERGGSTALGGVLGPQATVEEGRLQRVF